MKKALTTVIIAIIVMACQQKTAEIETTTNVFAGTDKDSTCIKLVDYYAINDDTTLTDEAKSFKKAEWLQINGANVCKVDLEIALSNHNVNPGDFTGLNAKPFSKSRQDIELLINGSDYYEKYIAFQIDGKDRITSMQLVDSFSISPICFSLPLFQYLFSRYKLAANDVLKFHVVHVKNKKTIVIEVLDDQMIKTFYYDFSNEPAFVDSKVDIKK